MGAEQTAEAPARMTIKIRGLSFTVTVGGPPGGTPVLLLHGFPQHSGEWDLVMPVLWEAGMRTYALDQRGYSAGARPPRILDYAVAECAADALAVLGAFGVERAHVVGHDWGAVVGWQLAAWFPTRVRTLTAISVPHPSAFIRALANDADQQGRSAYIQLFQREGEAEAALRADGQALLRSVLRGVPADRIERYLAPMREPGALTAALNWYRAMDWARPSVVAPVAVPTTYVWSDGDTALGRTAAQDCGSYVNADYRFVELSGLTHWLPDEAPEAVATAVLGRVDPGPRAGG